jgi:pimeloyl-ACP methyl ester carboxylesterase
MALLTLADGRTLDVQATGPEDGLVLVLHHGTPGSLVRFGAFEEAAERRGLRLVTYSRPGYGSSTRQPGRSIADVAADLEAVLDHLGAARCVTLGWSGGGPHALACAALLPERVAAAASVAGVAPFGQDDLDFLAGMGEENILEFEAAVAGAQDLTPALQGAAEGLRSAEPAEVIKGMAGLLPPVDQVALEGDNGRDLAAMLAAGLLTGADGWIDDDLAFVAPWDFDLSAVRVPVFVWQGEADLMVPAAHGRWLAAHIPGAVAHLQAGRGHLSIFFDNIDEIFDELVAAAQA